MKRLRGLKTNLIQLFLYLTLLKARVAETSLPCEAADEDPDEGNPMDNLSCPFADGLQCIAVSELCDGHSVCVGDYDEGGVTSDYSDDEDGLSQQSGSGGVPVTVILECSNRTFQCSETEDNYLPINALCNGVKDCENGEDETNILCEDKCVMPYYGGCPYSRKCFSSHTGASCGGCLPGFTQSYRRCVVSVEFDQRKYYGSAMDGVTQQICINIGPQGTQLENISETARIDFGLLNVSVRTYDAEHYRRPRELTNSSFDVIIAANQTKYCFQIEVARFTGPRDEYIITMRARHIRFHSEVARLLIYETISYDVTAVFYPNSLVIKEDTTRSPRICVSLVSNNSFESPLIEISRVSVVLLNDTSSALGYDDMEEPIHILTFHRGKNKFVKNSPSESDYMECFRLKTLNNDLVEGNKTAMLGLARPTGAIRLKTDSQAEITILDDDRMVIGFSSEVYTTTESSGKVSVCVKLINSYNGKALEPFTIALLPDEGFETANTADDCYITIEFATGTPMECHNYSIKNDDVCEIGMFQQQFQIRLAVISTGRIPLRIDSERFLTTIIIDDSSEMECFVSVGFQESSASLSENDEPVEVCVNSTSLGIEEQFFINITSSDNATKFLIEPLPRLYFEVNPENLTDIQCFNLTMELTSRTVCQYFTDCTEKQFTLSLTVDKESNRVSIDMDRSTMDIYVSVPDSCGCLMTQTTSNLNSSISAATVGAIATVTLVVLIVVLILVNIVLYRRRWRHKQNVIAHNTEMSNTYTTLGESRQSKILQHLREELQDKKMIYSKDQIILSSTVGQGESGLVYKAYLKSAVGNKLVAVKTGKALFSTVDLERLAKEVSTMLSFEHTNVMSLIGVCIDGEMPLLIMPFMINGSVLHYVKRHKERLMIGDECTEERMEEARRTLLNMAFHITKGMEYLSGHKFVHRDLAARNCMIDERGIVKVADFGLTEEMYCRNYFRRDKSEGGREEKVPIRWMAPESIKNDIYNEATDVWSFGVTMWEIFTCGKVPYTGIHVMGIVTELQRGAVLEMPDNKACSDSIYQVMSSCWMLEADMRPKFSGLVSTINSLLENTSGYLELLHIPSFEPSPLIAQEDTGLAPNTKQDSA